MLMAAGLGTRLRPFTDRVSKPMLPLMGSPMAGFAYDAAAAAGVQKVVANTHHLASATEAGLLALGAGGGPRIEISDESRLLLGSAGGLRQAYPRLGGPFFLVNGDVLCSVDLRELAAEHRRLRLRHGVHLTLTIFPAGPAGEKYRELLVDPAQGLITGLGEPSVGCPYFVGVAVIEPEALAGIPPEGPAEFVPTVLRPAIERGKAGAFLAEGQWHDVGSPELWLRTHVAMLRGLETGRLPRAWRERIERSAVRVGQECWVGRGSSQRAPADWSGPVFWSGPGSPPRALGPETVVYGEAASNWEGRGIGLDGLWVPLPRASS